jgi:hypothetical protein
MKLIPGLLTSSILYVPVKLQLSPGRVSVPAFFVMALLPLMVPLVQTFVPVRVNNPEPDMG